MKSAGGATLTLQSDGSILASGTKARGDVYTVIGVSDLDRIAAIRLEALPDPTLPNKGPGRHSSGNFHLSAFRLYRPTKVGEGERTPVPVERAWASFDYKGWDSDIAGTVDERSNKSWQVWGRLGEAHQAVFLVKDTDAVGGVRPLVIVLHHKNSPVPINLGRFRLSVSSDRAAVDWEQ